MDREELLNKLDELGFDPEDFEDDTEEDIFDFLGDNLRSNPQEWPCWKDYLTQFREEAPITKEQVLSKLKKMRECCTDGLFSGHSESYIKTLNGVLDEFYKKIQRANFPEPLPDFWCYDVSVSIHSARLRLQRLECSFSLGDDLDGQCDNPEVSDIYTLITVPVRKLSVNEYAALYGVEPVTVRQWIRRGRIRSAEKVQKEWLISELTDMPQERGYISGGYSWMPPLQNIPKEYEFLNRFSWAWFEKVKNAYAVHLNDEDICRDEFDRGVEKALEEPFAEIPEYRDTTRETLTLSAGEREKLERFMIESGEIEFFSEKILAFDESPFISIGGESYYEDIDSNIKKCEVRQIGGCSVATAPVILHKRSS